MVCHLFCERDVFNKYTMYPQVQDSALPSSICLGGLQSSYTPIDQALPPPFACEESYLPTCTHSGKACQTSADPRISAFFFKYFRSFL